jgi:hypothetical protein
VSEVASIAVGLAAAAGAIAVYRVVERRVAKLRKALRGERRNAEGVVLDFERDPQTGIFRRK